MSEALLRLRLLDGQRETLVADVVDFVGADASGSFGLRPGHEPLLSFLEPGLFRYRIVSAPDWRYGACTGGMLHGHRTADGLGEVVLVSRRILLGEAVETLQTRLEAAMHEEAGLRASAVEQADRLDLALQRRLQQLQETAA